MKIIITLAWCKFYLKRTHFFTLAKLFLKLNYSTEMKIVLNQFQFSEWPQLNAHSGIFFSLILAIFYRLEESSTTEYFTKSRFRLNDIVKLRLHWKFSGLSIFNLILMRISIALLIVWYIFRSSRYDKIYSLISQYQARYFFDFLSHNFCLIMLISTKHERSELIFSLKNRF